MIKKTISITLALLLVLSLIPAFVTMSVLGEEGGEAVNFALASNGTSYTIVRMVDGAEKDPGFLATYPDNDFKLLNDGVSNKGETSGASVGLAGSSYVYRVKFNLGQERTFNKVVIKNMINSAAVISNGNPAGNRGYAADGFKVYVGSTEKTVTVSQKNNAQNYSMQVTLDFEQASGTEIAVEMKSAAYVLSLDEIEVYYEAPVVTTTDPSSSDSSSTTLKNHALASNGGSYHIVRLTADNSSEETAQFANAELFDGDFTKLNDGETAVGETSASVGLAGTNRTHRIKFDLGGTKHVAQIALKNMINSYSFSFGGSPAGNRSFDTKAITLTADGKVIPFNLYKRKLGQRFAYDIIIDFNAFEARNIVIEIKPDNVYVASLDEIEILNEKFYKRTEIELIDDGTRNYALAAKGATYEMYKIAGEREEEEEYASGYTDTEFLLLNDGYADPGEKSGSTVGAIGTGRTHLIKFDLGVTREINKIVLKNMINSANIIMEGESAGNRGYDFDTIKALVDGKEITATKEEQAVIGCGYAFDIVFEFEDLEAQYVTIEVKTSDNAFVLALNEVEIYGGHDPIPSETEPSETEPTETEPAFTILYGDVNLDGNVDSDDARFVLRYDSGLIDLSEEALTNGEVSGDGAVDADDARFILRYDSGFIDSFPVENQ